MKSALSIILSLLVFAASFGSSLALADYQLNREYYETQCVNKAKPEMHCHGKCALEKREKTTGSTQLLKICTEFNFFPAVSTVRIHGNTVFQETKKISHSGSFPLLEGFCDTSCPPPSI